MQFDRQEMDPADLYDPFTGQVNPSTLGTLCTAFEVHVASTPTSKRAHKLVTLCTVSMTLANHHIPTDAKSNATLETNASDGLKSLLSLFSLCNVYLPVQNDFFCSQNKQSWLWLQVLWFLTSNKARKFPRHHQSATVINFQHLKLSYFFSLQANTQSPMMESTSSVLSCRATGTCASPSM